MCAILDTNAISDFCNLENADMEPVRKWLGWPKGKRIGNLVYSDTEKFEQEYPKSNWAIKELRRAGYIKNYDAKLVETEQDNLGPIESDDPHIIALARVSGAKLLISYDTNLHEDFKNSKLVGGRVYQNRSHSHLLTKQTCP